MPSPHTARAMLGDDDKLKVYLAHRTALIHYATPLTGSRDAAEDVVQDAWFRFAKISDAHQPAAYLYRIVRNLALDLSRRLSMESRHQQAQHDDIPHLWLVPGALPEPERSLSNAEQLQHVAEAIAALPDNARQALEMYRLGEARLEQIAHTLNVSVSTAQRLVQQAMVNVALHLEQANQTEPARPPRDPG